MLFAVCVCITNIRFACNIIIIIIIWWKILGPRSLALTPPSRVRSSKQINNTYLFLCFFCGTCSCFLFCISSEFFMRMWNEFTFFFVDVIICAHNNILLLYSSMLKFLLRKLNQKLFYNSILNMLSYLLFFVVNEMKKNMIFCRIYLRSAIKYKKQTHGVFHKIRVM